MHAACAARRGSAATAALSARLTAFATEQVQKSASHYTEAAWDEIEILRQVRHRTPARL
jgi:hypothetical protein